MRIRASAAVGISLLTWVGSDILIWQRIFEAHVLKQFDPLYQAGHFAVLAGLIVLGALLVWHPIWSAWYAVTTYVIAHSGAADVLYYWLDGRAVPPTLPWLDVAHPLILFHPVTAAGAETSSLVWIVQAGWAMLFLSVWQRGRRLAAEMATLAGEHTSPELAGNAERGTTSRRNEEYLI